MEQNVERWTFGCLAKNRGREDEEEEQEEEGKEECVEREKVAEERDTRRR
jgi:hypothetical protein